MRLLRNLGVVSGLTLVSRLAGFVREILTAAYLGAGPVADTFFQALIIPNTFRRILAEGAFNAAFVPLYARRLEGEDQAEADRFASEALSVLVTATLGVVLAFQLAAPWLVYAFFPGLIADPEGLAFGALLLQITMPYLLTMAVVALLSGALNSHGRFATAAAAPVLFNAVLIAILAADFAEDVALALWLSAGVTASGVLQALWLVLAARKRGLRIGLRIPRLTLGVKHLIRLGVPGALAAGAVQINVLVTSSIATLEPGARSWLNYAERLYQLPLGVIGIAMGVALLPDLARRLRAGDDAGGQFTSNRAIELCLALTLPAAAAFITVPQLLAEWLYERGAFTPADTVNTAAALAIFGIGLPAFVLVKVLQTGFFAREDTRTPMLISLASVGMNFALALGLFFGPMGFLGLATATVTAGWLSCVLLAALLARRGLLTLDARLRRTAPRLLLAALLMAVVVGAMAAGRAFWADPILDALGRSWGAATALLALVGAGGAVYAAAVLGTGAIRPGEIGEALRPRRRVGGPAPTDPGAGAGPGADF